MFDAVRLSLLSGKSSSLAFINTKNDSSKRKLAIVPGGIKQGCSFEFSESTTKPRETEVM